MKPVALFFACNLLVYSALFGQSARVANVKLQLISDQRSYPTAFAVAPGRVARLFMIPKNGRSWATGSLASYLNAPTGSLTSIRT